MRFFILFLFLNLSVFSQKDSAVGVPLLGVHVGGYLPSGDIAKRFGPNLSAGASFLYKTSGNWLLGAEASYLFGSTVKEDVLSQLVNSSGTITDNEGYPADLRLSERGLALFLTLGKVIPVFKGNANSGLMINFGAGYLRHKVNIYDAQQRVAAVSGDLKKGYDRLTAGFSISEFIGYMYVGKNRLSNFYGGFEFAQAFTSSLRKLNYSDGQPDTGKRIDIFSGIRIGWILPLYKKTPDDFYVY